MIKIQQKINKDTGEIEFFQPVGQILLIGLGLAILFAACFLFII